MVSAKKSQLEAVIGAIAGRASFSGGTKDMRNLEEMDTLKEIPGYKAALKAVLKSQIQYLAEQLSLETDEETIILSASTANGKVSKLGSLYGKDFLPYFNKEVQLQFAQYCLHKSSFAAMGKETATDYSEGAQQSVGTRSPPFPFHEKSPESLPRRAFPTEDELPNIDTEEISHALETDNQSSNYTKFKQKQTSAVINSQESNVKPQVDDDAKKFYGNFDAKSFDIQPHMNASGEKSFDTAPHMNIDAQNNYSARPHMNVSKKRHDTTPHINSDYMKSFDTNTHVDVMKKMYDARAPVDLVANTSYNDGPHVDSNTGMSHDARSHVGFDAVKNCDGRPPLDLDALKSYDTAFDARKGYDTAFDARKGYDTAFDARKGYDTAFDARKSYDTAFDARKSYDTPPYFDVEAKECSDGETVEDNDYKKNNDAKTQLDIDAKEMPVDTTERGIWSDGKNNADIDNKKSSGEQNSYLEEEDEFDEEEEEEYEDEEDDMDVDNDGSDKVEHPLLQHGGQAPIQFDLEASEVGQDNSFTAAGSSASDLEAGEVDQSTGEVGQGNSFTTAGSSAEEELAALVSKEVERVMMAEYNNESSRRTPGSSKKKRHYCDICQKSYAQKGRLTFHYKSMHSNEPMPEATCQICQQIFSSVISRKRHEQVMHFGIKPFQCEHCDKTFGTNYALANHVKGHHCDEESKITCETCGATFKYKSSLKEHQKRCGNPQAFTNYGCMECLQTFTSTKALQCHVQLKHGDQDLTFICEECGAKFSYRATYKRHMMVKHSGK